MSSRRLGLRSQPLSGERPSGPSPRSRHFSPLSLAGIPGSLKRACPRRLVLNASAAVRTRSKNCDSIHLFLQRHTGERGGPTASLKPRVVPVIVTKWSRLQSPSPVFLRAGRSLPFQLGRQPKTRAAKWLPKPGRRASLDTRRAWAEHPSPCRPGEAAMGPAPQRLAPRAACALRRHRRRSSSQARPPSQAAACGATASSLRTCSLFFPLIYFRRLSQL